MPTAVLHVGPHKTASSTLQKSLFYYRDYLRINDRVAQPFHVLLSNQTATVSGGSKSGWLLAMHLQGRMVNATLWNVFNNFVRAHAKLRHRLIISSEEFDQGRIGWPGRSGHISVNIPALASSLRPYNTTVVIAYRPFFEWVQSVHAEYYLNNGDHCKPGVKHRSFVPLPHWLTSKRIAELASDDGFYSAAVLQRYRRHFRDVRVHTMSNLLEDVVCDDLGATHTCTKVRADRKSRVISLPANHHFNARACSLAQVEGGLLAGRWLWSERNMTAANDGQSLWVANRTCLDSTRLETLLNLSLRFEEYLLAASTRPWTPATPPDAAGAFLHRWLPWLVARSEPSKPGAALAAHFDRAVASGAFCTTISRRAQRA